MRFRSPAPSRGLLATAVAVAAGLCASAAHASLVFGSAEDFQGTGLGAVNTILTISSPDSTTFEQGSVGRSSPGNVEVTTGDVKTGASQTQTRTLGDLGVTSAADLRVVFNTLEPGSAEGITLSDLVLNLYSPTGALLFTSGAFAPVTFADTLTGAGNSGFVFHLDADQALAAQAAAFGDGFEANQVGLSAVAGCDGAESATCQGATGGFETFFVVNTPVAAIPEPGTYALMAAGLGVLGFVACRRRRS